MRLVVRARCRWPMGMLRLFFAIEIRITFNVWARLVFLRRNPTTDGVLTTCVSGDAFAHSPVNRVSSIIGEVFPLFRSESAHGCMNFS